MKFYVAAFCENYEDDNWQGIGMYKSLDDCMLVVEDWFDQEIVWQEHTNDNEEFTYAETTIKNKYFVRIKAVSF